MGSYWFRAGIGHKHSRHVEEAKFASLKNLQNINATKNSVVDSANAGIAKALAALSRKAVVA